MRQGQGTGYFEITATAVYVLALWFVLPAEIITMVWSQSDTCAKLIASTTVVAFAARGIACKW